jgi:hypothetical protein
MQMDDFTDVKLEIFIPEDRIEALKVELAEAGAGRIGNYDHCLSISTVKGYWRPLDGANPFDGKIGAISEGTECKVEVNCRRERVEAVIKAVRRVHPYEEPVINVIPLANHLFTE